MEFGTPISEGPRIVNDWYISTLTEEFVREVEKIRSRGDFDDKYLRAQAIAQFTQGDETWSEKIEITIRQQDPQARIERESLRDSRLEAVGTSGSRHLINTRREDDVIPPDPMSASAGTGQEDLEAKIVFDRWVNVQEITQDTLSQSV